MCVAYLGAKRMIPEISQCENCNIVSADSINVHGTDAEEEAAYT